MSSAIARLIDEKSVIVTVGAGGVGKTTTAAAIALQGALRGKRVLCLTVDPAKRLAESFGFQEMPKEAAEIPKARFEAAGLHPKGTLSVTMLDVKSTFDDFVRRSTASPAAADRILQNRLYQYMSTSLAGTQEYMAMEKLAEVKSKGKYDLIVLDTPPTANALDFLDAPERLVDALDSAALKWFVMAFKSSGKFSLNILAKGAALALQTIGKITGGDFLEQLAELVSELSVLFDSFRERAVEVQKTLRAPDVAFLLVTSPSPLSVREALYFADRLREAGIPRSGFIVNRMHGEHGEIASEQLVGSALSRRGLEPGLASAIVRAASEERFIALEDARQIALLRPHLQDGVPIVALPDFPTSVQDLPLLAKLGEYATA